MTQRATAPARKTKTLAQEKADFTAEGSPPPGQVAAGVPKAPAKTAPTVPPNEPLRARKAPPAARR